MKKLLILGALLCITNIVAAQNTTYPEIPYIEVTGSADIEVDPDEIRLSIIISSYRDTESKEEIKLETVEKTLMNILSEAKIAQKNIIVKNASTRGYWYYWHDDERLTKQYEIILANYSQLDQVINKIPGPDKGFRNVNISELKNKNIAEYRKQTKIEAIKAAKEKARYLLESVGSQTGKLIQVIELDEDNWGWYYPASNSNMISQTSMNAGNGNNEDGLSMQKIKLRYRIKARFEIN